MPGGPLTETREPSLPTSFQPSLGTWLALAAAGVMLVAGVLAAITLGLDWMATSVSGTRMGYSLSEASIGGGSIEYSGEDGDGFDGAGLILAGKVLAIIGTPLAFVSMAVLVVSQFVRRPHLALIGSLLAFATSILLTMAVILAPIGINQWHHDFAQAAETFGGQEMGPLDWEAGLWLGIIAAVLAIGASALGTLSLREPVPR